MDATNIDDDLYGFINIALIKFSPRGREKGHKNYGHLRLKPAVRGRFGRRRDGEENDVLGKRYRDDQQGQFGGTATGESAAHPRVGGQILLLRRDFQEDRPGAGRLTFSRRSGENTAHDQRRSPGALAVRIRGGSQGRAGAHAFLFGDDGTGDGDLPYRGRPERMDQSALPVHVHVGDA